MNDVISVIVPVYNTKKQMLDRCINSILNQSYKNIEVLIIDDGSNNYTHDYCDTFKDKDNRIEVYHLKNGGPSRARNYGLKKSKGRYVCFVDSDDWILEEYINKLYQTLIKEDVPVVRCDYIEYLNENPIHYKRITKLEHRKYEGKDMEKVISKFLTPSSSNETYIFLLLIDKEKLTIEFNNKFKYLEDLLFYYEMFCNISSIYFLNECLYCKSTMNNGLTASTNVDEKIKIFYSVKKELIDLSSKYKTDKQSVEVYFNSYIVKTSLWYIGKEIEKYKNYSNFKDYLNEVYNEMNDNNCLTNVIYEDLSIASKIQIKLFSSKSFFLLFIFYKVKKIIRRKK